MDVGYFITKYEGLAEKSPPISTLLIALAAAIISIGRHLALHAI
jgi:hypothetical protein